MKTLALAIDERVRERFLWLPRHVPPHEVLFDAKAPDKQVIATTLWRRACRSRPPRGDARCCRALLN